MLNDLRFALRVIRKSPAFTAAVVLTIALGIGATTTMFSVVYAVLLRPLPCADPERLMQVAEKNEKLHLQNFGASVLNYLSWKEQTRAFETLGAIGFASVTLSGRGDPEQFAGSTISPSLFRLLDIPPVAGRAFLDEEERPGASRVAMISEGVWKRRFGGDRAVVGRHVTLNGLDTTIVGVAPPALTLLTAGDVWLPLTIDPGREQRLNHVISVVGRVRPGVSREQAQAEMDAIAVRVGQQFPEVKDWGITVVPLRQAFVGTQLRTALLVLLAGVVFVLLIACANVANLLLARASARQKEIAVRLAVGASRGRLLRQLLIESLTLSIAGGATGVVAAAWAIGAIDRTLPPNVLPISGIALDVHVLAFTAALTIATGVLFGIAPAWHSARSDVNAPLQQAARSSTGSRPAVRNALAAAELALATVLLIGAGLLVQTSVQLQRVAVGFSPRGLLTFQLAPPATTYAGPKAAAFYRELLESLRTIPGVRDAAISSGIPFGNGAYTQSPIETVGTSVLPVGTSVPIDWRIVSPGFFRTMSIPLLRGRDFTDADGTSGATPIVVSQATARTFWGADDPIGRVLRPVASKQRELTVIGVVGDVRNTALNQESPALYYPAAFRVWPSMDVVVRADSAPEPVLAAARQKIRGLDPELALSNVRTMDEWLANTAAQPRLNAALLAAYAITALAIAAVGIYGVLAYSVGLRTREIGLRLALGAPRQDVVRMVVREGMRLASFGIAGGVAAAVALSRVLEGLVFGVQVRDPATFVLVVIALAGVALVACSVPARRAARVDPMVALRVE